MHLEFAHSLAHCKGVSPTCFILPNNFLLIFKKLWQCQKKGSVVSALILQGHNGFTKSAKLCLILFSLKWSMPRRKRVRSLFPIGLRILYVELAWGRPIFSNEVLKEENDVAPFIFLSNLFHLFMAFGKHEF